MSNVLGFSSDRDKTRRKSCQRRHDSGELEVFDADGYFSINESLGHNGTTLFHELGIAIRDDCNSATSSKQGWREGRVSLDIPATRYTGSHHYHHHHHHHHHYHRQHSVSQAQSVLSGAKEKKHKQPSSPGGKLASFFNSLISQAISKKKKSSKNGATDQEESPSSWRRKSSNLSSFTASTSTSTISTTRTRTSINTSDAETKKAQSFSGFQSSPPYPINTPTKSYKDLSRFSASRCKNSTTKPNSSGAQLSSASDNLDWLDEKFKCIGGLLSEKQPNKGFDRHRASSDKEKSWAARNSCEETGEFKRFKEEDGGESDSSSDLFELQLNYECSSGLPVYETTCMDSIKRSSATPITNI